MGFEERERRNDFKTAIVNVLDKKGERLWIFNFLIKRKHSGRNFADSWTMNFPKTLSDLSTERITARKLGL